jgi:hypothetical protein
MPNVGWFFLALLVLSAINYLYVRIGSSDL